MSIRSTGFFASGGPVDVEVAFNTQDISVTGISFIAGIVVTVSFNTADISIEGVSFTLDTTTQTRGSMFLLF